MRAILFILLFASASLAADTNSELRVALADARKHPLPRQARYVTTFAMPGELQAVQALSLTINSVSRGAKIVKPVRVSATVYRIDMAEFGLDPKLWESLVGNDPYWHIRTKVVAPGTGKTEEVVTDGGWVDLKAAGELRELTGSAGAIFRADWFIARVATTPAYYQWAGIPETSKEFNKQIGADPETIISLRATKGENILKSGVTQKVRRISRWTTPLGSKWATWDSEGVDPKKDFIRNPGFDAGADASEVIATQANGLLRYVLFNGEGVRQDAVPDKIARDHSDLHGDQRLIPMLSCVRCHAVDGGYRKYATDQTDLFKAGSQLLTSDPAQADQLTAFYDAPKLARQFSRDVEDYGDAIKDTTGLDAKEAAKALSDVYDYYQNLPLGAEAVSRELGVAEVPQFAKSSDGILASILLGKQVSRQQFEASYQEAAVLTTLAKP